MRRLSWRQAAALGWLLLLPLFLGASSPARVPITFHLSLTKDSLTTSNHWIDRSVRSANTLFSSAGIFFSTQGTILFSEPGPEISNVAQRHQLARLAPTNGTIHVFIVERLADKDRAGGWIGGVHWRYRGGIRAFQGRRYIIVSYQGAAEDTLAHELGHFLGLQHGKDPHNLMTSPGREPDSRLCDKQIKRVQQILCIETRRKRITLLKTVPLPAPAPGTEPGEGGQRRSRASSR